MEKTTFIDVDSYIRHFPEPVGNVLSQIRKTIQAAAPEATEKISYGMPAYHVNGKPLVYFAAYARHIGFYATPTGHEAFKEALAPYKQGKGSVQFPLDRPMPFNLITQIVRFRVGETSQKK